MIHYCRSRSRQTSYLSGKRTKVWRLRLQTNPTVVELSGLLGMLLVLAAAGCSRTNPEQQALGDQPTEKLSRVVTVPVELRDLEQTIEMPGTVEGFDTADLYAKLGGYLETISVDIGDPVKQGQELAKLSVPEMQKEVEQKQAEVDRATADVGQAQAAIGQADAEVKHADAKLAEAKTVREEKEAWLRFRQGENQRMARLVELKSINRELLAESQFQLESAQAVLNNSAARIRSAAAELAAFQANVEKAKSDLKSVEARRVVAQKDRERAEALLRYATIRAPFDGFVTRRYVDPGAFIQPAAGNSAAQPLLTITHTNVVRVFLDVPMDEIRWLNRDDPAVLSGIRVLPGQTFTGQVTRYSAALDQKSRLLRVEIDLPNPQHQLVPGMYGSVKLMLAEFPHTPVIHSSALLSAENELYVYVVENGVCHKRVVTTNYQDGTMVGIATGLRGGEQIVQAGGGQLADGQKVVAVEVKAGS